MHIFKCFENESDTYHDTRTRYIMEQDPLLLQNQADAKDVIVADRWEALKNNGPSRAKLRSYGSRYSISRTCGPRDIIFLVIPRIGDNNPHSHLIVLDKIGGLEFDLLGQ